MLYVVEGADNRDLERGPGHLTGTVLPGEDGNCVIAGHRDTHFRVLRKIRKGDEVVLERAGKAYRYAGNSEPGDWSARERLFCARGTSR